MKKIKILIFSFLLAGGAGILLHTAYKYSAAPEEYGPESYPSEWFWLQRTFPYNRAEADVYRKALAQRKHMQFALQKRAGAALWNFAGPENIGGRITDIEFDPQDAGTVYAAAATGGVFVSYNKGINWQPIFDEQAVLTVGDMAIDPTNSQTIYVGTGEANGGHNNFPGGGLYKSTDSGQSWEFMGLGHTASIGRILVDPKNTRRIFVAAEGSYFTPDSNRGVYMSPDGGKTWQKSLFVSDSTGAIDLVMDPANPDFMLAAMWERVRRPVKKSETHLYGKTSAIYRTFNGGRTWQKLPPSSGLPDARQENVGRIGLAMYPADSHIIYALYNDGTSITGLFRSNDGGDSWTKTKQTPESGTFSWYFGQVRVSPDNPDVVFVMDAGFMRSEDGGDSWKINYGYNPSYAGLHVDHHALAFSPDDANYLIEGNDGGLNISEDGGYNWSKVASLPVTQFYEIGLDASNPRRYYGGTQDNGTLRTAGGLTDDWESILGGDGFYVLVRPDDPEIIYCEYQFGALYKYDEHRGSYQKMQNSEMSDDPHNWATPLAMDPKNYDVLYYGTNRIWRTEDAGDNWSALSENLTRNLADSRVGTLTSIAVAPTASDVIYAGTDDGLVWVSADYGQSWNNISSGLPFRWVTRVLPDPVDAGTVYVTFSGLKWRDPQPHIFKSTDYGSHWQDISANLPDAPLNAIAVDSLDNSIIYVGSDVGAFFSMDSGRDWQLLGKGLPAVVVNDLKINPITHELVAGTYGRSMYKLDLNGIVGLAENTKPNWAGNYRLYQNYPNPFNPETLIHYRVQPIRESVVPVKLYVYNTLGQKVRTLVDQKQSAGDYRLIFRADNLSSGVYFYTLQVNRFVQTRKMILLQ